MKAEISNVVLELLCSAFLVIRDSSNKRRIGTVALIDFSVPNAALIRVNTVGASSRRIYPRFSFSESV